MRVIVAGAGALGSLLGSYLAEAGEDVTLLGREAHVAAICRQGGLRVSGLRGERLAPLTAVTEIGLSDPEAGLVILGAKTQDVETVLPVIRPVVGGQTQILSPQNGVATEDFVADAYGQDRSLAAVTLVNVSLVEPGHIFHAANEHLEFGPRGVQSAEMVQSVVDAFRRAGIPASRRDDIMQLKWRKMITFCLGSVINSLTGAQHLAEDDDICRLMRQLAEEIIAVAETGQVTPFPIRPLVEEAYGFWQTFNPARPWLASVGQDLRRGKSRTEIDFLSGYIVTLGRRYGVSTPANHCLYALVKAAGQTDHFKQA